MKSFKSLQSRMGAHILLLLTSLVVFSSCHKDEPEPSPVTPSKVKRTILVYAIAANSLSSNLESDMSEMLDGMARVNMDNYRLLLCKVQLDRATYTPTPQELMEVTKSSDGNSWRLLKRYSSEYRSVDKDRISEVISDVTKLAPADDYGLIFWSHSDAWNPSSNYTVPLQRSFGQERDGSQSYYCEVTDLAEAIPDNFADFIWFDSCYMANIETAYELRNKCKWYIGSTIELHAAGMPYNLTLPYLLSENASLIDAAKTTYNHYTMIDSPVSMSVYDMSKIDGVVNASTRVLADFTPLKDCVNLQRYSRNINPALYDFYDYMESVSEQNNTDISSLRAALDEFIVYKASTTFGWGGMSIRPDKFSGVSCNAFQDGDEAADVFYRTLDWYKKVYKATIIS